jgi:site-specific DNA-cytosine methylase
MKNKIKVLSLFDGISGGAQALKELGIECEYYASEIDKWAIQISKKNHPDIIQIGDVKGLELEDSWLFYNQNNDPMKNGGSFKADFDLLIGGSPCQDLSIAKRSGKGLEGEKSGLFYEYLRTLNQVKPKFFILENVASMKKENRDKISELLGVEPAMINSALVTAQNRKRYYWVGKNVDGKYETVDIPQPKDSNPEFSLDKEWGSVCVRGSNDRVFKRVNKFGTLTATYFKGVRASGRPAIGHNSIIGQHIDNVDKTLYRMLTPIECERLQGFPDNYTDCVSNTQRYKALGNSFTVPVIQHLLKAIYDNQINHPLPNFPSRMQRG